MIQKLPSGRYQVRWRDKTRKQRAKNFRTKEMAQDFCRKLDKDEVTEGGSTLKELMVEYQASAVWQGLDYPTQITYRRTMERWFDLLEATPIGELDPARVSRWIGELKANADRFGKAKQRQSFTKELNVLRSLLAWYRGYKDDDGFVSPIRARHEQEVWLDGKAMTASDVDFEGQVSDEIPLTEEEFLRFRDELAKAKFGRLLVILADIQFDHSLRVCEAAAVMWPDIRWTEKEIKFQRHIQYVHQARGLNADKVAPGLKNRKSVKRRGQRFARRQALSKTNPFFPRSTAGLRELYLKAVDKTGYVFTNPETGTYFHYKCIKDKFDRAFRRAKLPYQGTHIVRYGGVNHFLEHYGADDATGMELLGNNSEGRYILRRSRRVADAIKKKEPCASNDDSALSTTGNFQETSVLSSDGGMDGVQLATRRLLVKTAQ